VPAAACAVSSRLRPDHSLTDIIISTVLPESTIVTVELEPSVTPIQSSMFVFMVDCAARVHVAPPPLTLLSGPCGPPPIITMTSPTAGGASVIDSVSVLDDDACICWTSVAVEAALSGGAVSIGDASRPLGASPAVSSQVCVSGAHIRPSGQTPSGHG